ncbi:hypothetical protein RJ640_008298 [Escallonia rubra]|uniref:AT-hook motif nuclear-localized protein n=1 Tax=Escallonia rubra TaxID=112253 RepID=A0AA88U2U6_9ASTE|nr:hypothetical protein RJ640_008298 [Escallonia rubra]
MGRKERKRPSGSSCLPTLDLRKKLVHIESWIFAFLVFVVVFARRLSRDMLGTQDIYEKTVTYFQDREKFPACFQGHPCMATILSVTGCVSNPMLELGGSAICFEGSRPVLSMSGLFSVDKDGQAHQRGKLQITFPNADGHIFGGPVTGSLTAATPMQVTVSFFTCEEEEEGEEEEEEEEEDEEEEEEEEEEQEQEEE